MIPIVIHSRLDIPIDMIIFILLTWNNGMINLTDILCTQKGTEFVNKYIPVKHELILMVTIRPLTINRKATK